MQQINHSYHLYGVHQPFFNILCLEIYIIRSKYSVDTDSHTEKSEGTALFMQQKISIKIEKQALLVSSKTGMFLKDEAELQYWFKC